MLETRILLDKKNAAHLLSISLRTLDHLIARGDLSIRRIGRRCLIERRVLERFSRRDHGSLSLAGDGTHAVDPANKPSKEAA